MSNSKISRSYPDMRWIVVWTQTLILVLLISSAFIYWLDPHAGPLIYPACVSLVALFIWSVWSWQVLTTSLFDPYVLFLIAATLFNGGHAILEVFHLNKAGILSGQFSPETILGALFLVILGLASFHLGALIGAANCKASGESRSKTTETVIPARHIRLVGWGLLCISLVPAIIVLEDAVTVVMSSGYLGLFGRETATGFGAVPRVLAAFLIPAGLFLLAGSKGQWGSIIVSGIIVVSYSTLQFFLGDRSSAVLPLLAYAWLWHHCIRPLPRTILIIAGSTMLFVIFPAVRVFRSIAGGERLVFSSIIDAFFSIDNPAVAIVSELGGSMMTVANTLELVPHLRSFDMGVGYLYAFLTIIPNLFWDVHPTIARGLAADWLVWTINPSYAALGGGYGFSFIAEAYLNFGWIGAPLALGFIGFLFARLVLWAQRSGEPAKMAAVASFLAFFLIYARGESGSVIRPLIWYALLPYCLVFLIPRLRNMLVAMFARISITSTR